MTTFIHKFKCLACSLHFAVYSWSADWKTGEDAVVYCPECGESLAKLRFAPEESDRHIFEYVPGGSVPAGLT